MRVLFFGVLKDVVGRSEDLVDIEPNSTLETLFEGYAKHHATLTNSRSSILFARNREFSKPDTYLREGDEVAFLPPVSGGTGQASGQDENHLFAIQREPLDSMKISEVLKRDEDGAVVIFEGIVRNNTKGRATRYLEYESYEEMALAQLARIGKEIAAEFSIGRIGIVHRLGRLEIGEPSISIVATAPHRRPAFEAALEAIDRVKREVPIWKKEYFADGELWVEGEWASHLLTTRSASRGDR